MAFGLPRKGLLVRKAAPTPIKGDPEPGAVFMKTTLVADPPVWPDWSVTAGIASVAGTLARMRERQATYGYREADSSLTPAVEGLRELAAAGGDDAAALANAAGHLAAAQRCLDDAWLGDDDERRRGRMEAASAALADTRARLQGMEGSVVEAARAAIGRAESNFTLHYKAGDYTFVVDLQDPAGAAAELSTASGHLATADGDGAASAAHAADLAAHLAASLAHAMSHYVGISVLRPTLMRERL